MKLTFYGATDGVTGSKYLLETNNKKILIEYGLFQGRREEEDLNWENFPVEPSSIDAVIITHSHIDHVGLIPKLVRDGFSGPIYSTDATRDFSEIFLPDSGSILAKVAKDRGKEALYDDKDIDKTIKQFSPISYHETKKIFPGTKVTFYDAGHILGSAIVKIESEGKSILFSGDLGNPPVPIIKDTEFIPQSDFVVMESTYGDRSHTPGVKREEELEKVIEETFTKKGTLLIPAFAMERTQELLYELNDLVNNNRIPKIPIYIDSPLAIKATRIYPKYAKYFDKEAQEHLKKGDRLFDFPNLKMINSVEQSKAIDKDDNPKIIIAGSGMSTGGRILFHEKRFLSDPRTTLLIIGFQVNGTLGRKLQEGEKKVEIYGHTVHVNARIKSLYSYSAHADKPKLIYWLERNKTAKQVFLVHGEKTAKESLKSAIEDETGLKTTIPKYSQTFEL